VNLELRTARGAPGRCASKSGGGDGVRECEPVSAHRCQRGFVAGTGRNPGYIAHALLPLCTANEGSRKRPQPSPPNRCTVLRAQLVPQRCAPRMRSWAVTMSIPTPIPQHTLDGLFNAECGICRCEIAERRCAEGRGSQ
jgi:hypothetical protein